ncbi:hypothetical protein N7478_011255 [Penicillium angulare]|uniref:uncharacterized protein n=1 Tax=Penicillium angulare TaxID=116970 RepID=UPI00254261A0|nr:uncharacterized protein N7478_011255 [Penicillium angulare]KAJ5263650.1 hypothetical protein N7478_011255 [Penicillium angulare]
MRDKLHLALMGVLGPEFLLMVTLGEWSSARASVKGFHELGHHNWSIVHGFYADMGGFVLEGPGIKTPFPVDGRQLLFLIRKDYVRYPDLAREDISDRNKSDGLARCIAIFQALWMVVNSLVRVAQGLALTTIELTTLSFILVFLITSFCWYFKPLGITTRVTLQLETHLDKILIENGHSLQETWYCTPLDFLHEEAHACERFWRYYTCITQRLHWPIFSRSVKTIPYNRIPSDRFLVLDFTAEILGAPIIVSFGCIFMFAWNFSFPSAAEKVLWRIAIGRLVDGEVCHLRWEDRASYLNVCGIFIGLGILVWTSR